MKKCSDECIPCCDFCIHCLHAYAGDGGGRCEPMGCTLHQDYEHQCIVEACGDCDDFHCFLTHPTNADRIRGMSDEELAEFLRNIRDCGDYDELKLIGGVRMDYVSVIEWLRQPAETEVTE